MRTNRPEAMECTMMSVANWMPLFGATNVGKIVMYLRLVCRRWWKSAVHQLCSGLLSTIVWHAHEPRPHFLQTRKKWQTIKSMSSIDDLAQPAKKTKMATIKLNVVHTYRRRSVDVYRRRPTPLEWCRRIFLWPSPTLERTNDLLRHTWWSAEWMPWRAHLRMAQRKKNNKQTNKMAIKPISHRRAATTTVSP